MRARTGPTRRALDGLARRSVAVILENQAPSGAYIASPSLAPYRFSWFRDGAFIADAISRAGYPESAEAFFGWCSDVIVARAERVEHLIARHRAGESIEPWEHLHCRYTVDGREVDMPWANFQLDGYGMWVWALGRHATRQGVSTEPYLEAVALSLRYAAEFWAEPCFDWWEERFGRHTATLASIYGGLRAAEDMEALPADLRAGAVDAAARIAETVARAGVVDGRLTAGLGDGRLDASVVACATPFRLLRPDDPVIAETVGALEETIAHGGVHRYAEDAYYGGGEWILLAALLGWHYAAEGRLDDAWAQLEWVAAQATEDGDLPEQVATHLVSPGTFGDWVRRWGPSASPLLWSHAMFLTLALELGVEAPRGEER